MATYQEIIDRAVEVASGAVATPVQDAGLLAEALLPDVLFAVTERLASVSATRQLMRRTVSITLTTNVGELPDTVFTEFIRQADVVDVNGDNASWCLYNTLIRLPDPRLAWFAIKQDHELHYLPVGGGTYDDDLEITVVAVPDLPTDPNDDVDLPTEAVDDVIEALADAIVARYKGVA